MILEVMASQIYVANTPVLFVESLSYKYKFNLLMWIRMEMKFSL